MSSSITFIWKTIYCISIYSHMFSTFALFSPPLQCHCPPSAVSFLICVFNHAVLLRTVYESYQYLAVVWSEQSWTGGLLRFCMHSLLIRPRGEGSPEKKLINKLSSMESYWLVSYLENLNHYFLPLQLMSYWIYHH